MKRFNAKYMPTNDVKRFIDQIESFTFKLGSRLRIINFGLNGEPLLHPKIIELVSHAKNKAETVRISTNLDKLTPRTSKALLEAGLNSICFSIDECEKERFEAIRKNLNFEKTVYHAKEFKKIRDDGGYKCRITVSPVDCIETRGRHDKIKRFWSKVSDSKIQMSKEIPIAHNLSRTQPWFDVKSTPPCVDMIGLKSNGDVLPCCFDVFHEYVLGNLYRQPIDEIFYGNG
jgi:MoaA/NifB/PqqE/SkfB family radical SAM enzyme